MPNKAAKARKRKRQKLNKQLKHQGRTAKQYAKKKKEEKAESFN
jgi:hypothetical protein